MCNRVIVNADRNRGTLTSSDVIFICVIVVVVVIVVCCRHIDIIASTFFRYHLGGICKVHINENNLNPNGITTGLFKLIQSNTFSNCIVQTHPYAYNAADLFSPA